MFVCKIFEYNAVMNGFKHHMYNGEKMKYHTDYEDRAVDNIVYAAACGLEVTLFCGYIAN